MVSEVNKDLKLSCDFNLLFHYFYLAFLSMGSDLLHE